MKKILMILLIFSLALTGCNNSGKDVETFESPYIGGIEGLQAEFETMGSTTENDVNQIWEDETFPIQVILKNKGEKDIEPSQAQITLKGFAQNDFSGISSMQKSNPIKIEKISEFLTDGGEERIDFGNAQYEINFDGFYDAIIQAEINYYYETFVAVPQVCFKYELRDDTVCTIEESKNFYVSSAPIQVTSVVEKPGGRGTIYLELEVANLGTGRSAVPGEVVKVEYDKIAFDVVGTNSNSNLWECTSGGVVGVARLTAGKATIRCKADVPTNALYTQQFSLNLKYNYVENIRENVRIKEALEN